MGLSPSAAPGTVQAPISAGPGATSASLTSVGTAGGRFGRAPWTEVLGRVGGVDRSGLSASNGIVRPGLRSFLLSPLLRPQFCAGRGLRPGATKWHKMAQFCNWRRLRWWRRPRPGLSRGGGQSARRARPRRPPDETSPRPPARRAAWVCRGAWPLLAAFGRFFIAPKATPEPDLAVFWPFRAGFGPAAAAANRGPHGGGAHASRSSAAGGDSVPSAGRVWGAVFSWAMEQSIGIGHAFVSWRRAAETVARHGEPILPNIYVFVNI